MTPGQSKRTLQNAPTNGFAFTPAPDRQLRVFADAGEYHPQPEWCENIPHPVEQSRGQTGSGDAYSPGWFEMPLPKGDEWSRWSQRRKRRRIRLGFSPSDGPNRLKPELQTSFESRLIRAAKQFVVRRGRRQDGHRRLSVVFGLGARHADLRARFAGRRNGGRSQANPAHVREV